MSRESHMNPEGPWSHGNPSPYESPANHADACPGGPCGSCGAHVHDPDARLCEDCVDDAAAASSVPPQFCDDVQRESAPVPESRYSVRNLTRLQMLADDGDVDARDELMDIKDKFRDDAPRGRGDDDDLCDEADETEEDDDDDRDG